MAEKAKTAAELVSAAKQGIGMLEFYADPSSPYYRDETAPDGRVILHCAAGGRSALAVRTLQELGYANVAHLDGGFGAWAAAGQPVEKEHLGM